MEDFTLPDFPGMPPGRGPEAPGLRQDHGAPRTPMPQRTPPLGGSNLVTEVGPRHHPVPPPPLGEQKHDHVRDRIIYKNIVFDDFHKLWTVETGIQISVPKVQEISQWKILHEY